MENIFIEFLPPWVETNLQPAFYDKESGTVLQQTARMYDRVNMLIRMFNKLSKNTKETVEDYITKFNELREFCEDYFANLDVQEEINNKLDQMAEAGTLADIIAGYIQLRGVLAYDTVTDLKNATNIVEGSFAETYGFYERGDGGSALYKIRNITNDDVVDEMFLIEISSDPQNLLVAELIKSSVLNVKQLGIKGDGQTDETQKIANAINTENVLYFPSGTYLIATTINTPSSVNIMGDGENTVFNSTDGVVFPVLDFSGSDKIKLQGFSTNNSSFRVYPVPPAGKTAQEMMKDKDIYISNMLCNTVNTNITSKTNWEGLFINTPAPNHHSPRDFEDGRYGRYGIELYNNSGYNALNIENVHKDENGNFETVVDNSAIGIVDGVLSSAQALFIDMKAPRCAIGVKNRTDQPSASSTARPDLVYEVGHNGHLAIGCSVYSEDGATGTGTIKLKDNEPIVRFYDTNYPTHTSAIRLKDDKFQTIANGLVRSEYLNNGYHEYSYPIRIKSVADSHGGLIFGTNYIGGRDAHLFCSDSNGFLKFNYSNPDVSFTSDAGYIMQPCISGNTANRPTSRLTNDYQAIGFRYFDTTLGKPVFWNGTGWVDANGTSV